MRTLHGTVSLLFQHTFLVTVLNHKVVSLVWHRGVTTSWTKIQLHHLIFGLKIRTSTVGLSILSHLIVTVGEVDVVWV